MRAVFTYQLLRLVRDKELLFWQMAFPIVLSLLFMGMFSGLQDSMAVHPLPIGVVRDQALGAAPGFDEALASVSGDGSDDGDAALTTTTGYPTAEEARRAALEGDTVGYIAVENGRPVLYLTAEGNDSSTAPVLRAALDAYVQGRVETETIATALTADPPPESPSRSRAFTRPVSVTRVAGSLSAPYYLALLAFSCATGMTAALVSVRGVTAAGSALGARRTLAALPRWSVLMATLLASWVCITACLLIAFVFMLVVAGLDVGTNAGWCLIAIALASLMSCTAGAALGTTRMPVAVVSGAASLLSLFTGLYGPGSQTLARRIEDTAPLAAHANPLWQCMQAFRSLLYYDTLGPFARACGVMAAMTALFLGIAVVRLRRMSHDYL